MANSSDMNLKQEDYISEQGDLFSRTRDYFTEEVSDVIKNQEDCDTAHEAVMSESAIKILGVLMKIYSRKHSKDFYSFTENFLERLQSYELPEGQYLQEYDELIKSTDFILVVKIF